MKMQTASNITTSIRKSDYVTYGILKRASGNSEDSLHSLSVIIKNLGTRM